MGKTDKVSAWLSVLFRTLLNSFNATAVTVLYDEVNFPVLQATFVTYLVIWTVTTLIYFWLIPDQHILGETRQEFWFLLTRSILFFGGLNCYLLSLIILPIGFATTLMFTHPLFMTLGTWIWYRQRPRLRELVILVTGAAGLLLMFAGSMIDGDRFDPRWRFGVLLAFLSGICIGVEQIYKNTLSHELHWVLVEYMTSFLFVMGIIPLSWLFQYLYIRTIGKMHFHYSNIFLADPNMLHWVVFIVIGFLSILTNYGKQKAKCILDGRWIKLASYLQVPILYLVDVLWFENGLPRLFEILGSSLFFIVLIVKSLFVPTTVSKHPVDDIQEGECESLLGSTVSEERNFEVRSDCTQRNKGVRPGGGAYGSI